MMQKMTHLWDEQVHLPSVEDMRFAAGQGILQEILAVNQDTDVLVILCGIKQR